MHSSYVFRFTKRHRFDFEDNWPHGIKIWHRESLFLPCFQDVMDYWKDFLCKHFRRSYLYLHYLYVRHEGKARHRFLNNDPMLVESLIKTERLDSIDVIKTMKVFNEIPIVWRKMTKIPISFYKDIE